MKFRGLLAVLAVAVFCGTPLASAMPSHVLRLLDGSPPVIHVPSGVTATSTNGVDASVHYDVSLDDPDGDPDPSSLNCSPASDTNFAIGTTTVTCNASDLAGNAANPASFAVTVNEPAPPPDTTPPTITAPGDFPVEATSPSGATVSYSASATDNVDGPVGVSCVPGSGSVLGLGAHTITCTASDSSHNDASKTFTVTVQDTTAPTLSLPGTITVPAGGSGGAFVSYTVGVDDAVDDTPSLVCSPSSGSMFPVGTTNVSCTVKDDSNNSRTGSFAVQVKDQTPPTISVPSSMTVEATSTAGATVTFSVTASDAIDPSPDINCNHGSGSVFPIGTTHVSCTATDASGNTSSPGTFDVTVRDSTPPSLTVPGPITAEATSGGGAVVTFSASATDALDASPTVSCSPGSGSTFGLGTTTVSCTASDHSGNTSSPKTFTVKVQDTTDPTISLTGPGGTVAATGPSGATVTYTVNVSDAVDSSPTVTCSKNSGTTFAIGTTHVSCTAKDDAGNVSAAAGLDITVQDQTAPTIDVPDSPVTKEATSGSGATVTFTATGHDSIDSSPTVTCDHPSGSTFPIGTTHVSCTAKDDAGNVSTPGLFDVQVKDSTAPTLTVPTSTVTANAPGPGGAAVTFTVSATDLVDPSPTITCSKNSGDNFPLGTTTVSCTAKDSSNNVTLPKTFSVLVQDRTPPTVSVPGPISKEATGISGVAVTFTVTATDAIDPSPVVTCTPASGSTFGVGTTSVSCTGKDASGNTSAAATFNVTVTDTTPPTLSDVPADITVEANGPDGSKVNYLSPTAVDLVNGPIPSVPCSPGTGSTFHLGSTTVNCTATDSHGNVGTASFKVNVVDTTPPTLIPPGNWSAYAVEDSGTFASDDSISRFIFGSHVDDIADPHPVITHNAPAFFPVGATTVKFTATDASGNKASASATLTILPKPAPGTTPPPLPPPSDNKPPGNVTNVQARVGDGKIIMRWTNPTDADFDHVEITRTNGTGPSATRKVVYSGKGKAYTDTGLQNDVEVRYVISSVDKIGNHSGGVAVVGVPKRALLRTPADGVKLKKVPAQFVWVADPKASYYNLQLYQGGSLLLQSTTATSAAPKKVMSVFPTGTVFKFKTPWKWEGRTYKMTKGLYTWYIWPGYGPREDIKYGRLMGAATFQITQTPAKPKPKPKKKKK